MKSLKDVFGGDDEDEDDVTILGCYFHWRKTLWKNMGKRKLQSVYNADFENCQRYFKMFIALGK